MEPLGPPSWPWQTKRVECEEDVFSLSSVVEFEGEAETGLELEGVGRKQADLESIFLKCLGGGIA